MAARGAGGSPERWLGPGLALRFLARCFYQPPEVEWLEELSGDRLFEEWPLPSARDSTARGLALLRRWSDGWQSSQARSLVAEFHRLFVGPDRVLVAPWESVHRSRTKLTFQEPTLSVREAYSRFGLESPALHREPDDHIGLELAFAAHLAEGAARAAAANDVERLLELVAALREFLVEHLLAWAPGFFDQVSEVAESEWYRGIALLSAGTLEEVAERVEV